MLPIPSLEIQALELLHPQEKAKELGLNLEFIWNKVSPGATYDFILAYDPDLKDPLIEKVQWPDTSIQLENILEKTSTYYWTVRAHTEDGQMLNPKEVFQFRTEMNPALPSPERTNYYVSPEGRDLPNAGSIDQPFRSIAYASKQVPASENDTIHIFAGEYWEEEAIELGLETHLKGAGMDLVTIYAAEIPLAFGIDPEDSRFKLWYDGALIQLISPHTTGYKDIYSTILPPEDGNQEVSGFTIDGLDKQLKAGLWVENRNAVHLHHLRFKNIQQRGAVVAAGNKRWFEEPKFYLKKIKINDCSFINCGQDRFDETLGNLNIAQLDGAKIHNIQIQDDQGYGIKFIYDGYFKNTKIYDCQIQVSETDAKWKEDIAIELWNLGPGNEVAQIECNTWLSLVNHPEIFGEQGNQPNLLLHDVKLIDQDGESEKEGFEIGLPHVEIYDNYLQDKGFGIAIWDMGRKNLLIRNNIFYNTTEKNNWAGGAAIYIDNSRNWTFEQIHILNNVFDRHPITINIKGARIKDIVVKNNTFFNTSKGEVFSSSTSINFSNNIKYTAETIDWQIQGFVAGSPNYLSDPEYLYQGERWATYYRPRTGGFSIDKGAVVGLPYRGSAPDIGYHEYE